MGIASSGCGCGPASTTPAQQSTLQSTTTARTTTGSGSYTMTGSTSQTGVRDPAAAQRNLELIRQSVARFSDIRNAQAAGYKLNPDGGTGADQHWINDAVFRTGDGSNVALPATLMYHRNSDGSFTLTGVMISVDPKRHPLPDFGAGAWHTHPDDPQVNMHVWLGKTVEQGAFENNTGMI